ncbi:MAG: DUF3618 domain-containing protein [Acidobacteria bacterium]|nr:DUF3618 domain-containing protein [Acidobacteriota bacterium]
MDQVTGALNKEDDDRRSRERSVEDIERDIHRTQNEMSRTIDSIQYRLSPDYLKTRARMRMKDTSRGIMDRIKENPGASAITGLGLFMLLRGGSSSENGRDENEDFAYVMMCDTCGVPVYEHQGRNHGFTERMQERGSDFKATAREKGSDLKHKAADAAHSVEEKASDVKDRVQESAERMGERAHSAKTRVQQTARRAGRRTQRKFEEDPLLMGAIGIAAGALLGALIPETDRERELMGETRDDLMRRSKKFAREKGEQVKQVAEHAKDAAVDEAKKESKRQNLTGAGKDQQRQSQSAPTI